MRGAGQFFEGLAVSLADWAGGKAQPIDRAAVHLLDYFEQLSGLRTNGGLGLNPLQPSEVEAWSRLMGVKLRPWEAKALFKMDAAFVARVSQPKKEESSKTIDARDGAAVGAQMARLASSSSKTKRKPRHGSQPPADH